jgi:hypothetical protein
LLTKGEGETWDEGPAAPLGRQLNVERETWKDPMLERGTWELFSHHIGRGTREEQGTWELTDYGQATRDVRLAVRHPTSLVEVS